MEAVDRFHGAARGRLVVDAGARQAVEMQGRSLLAIGVRDTTGDFEKGDIVALCDEAGQEFARGLTNYPRRAKCADQGPEDGQDRRGARTLSVPGSDPSGNMVVTT